MTETAGKTRETALVWANSRGENLVGVWHAPPENGPLRGAILSLHGWSGFRTGPHQMLTRAAREFAPEGFATLRFDFAGRGDSDGDADFATLATMRDDALGALEVAREKLARPELPIYVLGLCSGCEIAVALVGDERARGQIAGALLWSAPVFAALPSGEREAKKRGENLRKYAAKLLQISTYRKLLRGQIDTQSVSKAMKGKSGAAFKNLESDAAGQLPVGFRAASMQGWQRFAGPVLQIYGGADPITEEAQGWYRQNSGASFASRLSSAVVAGANHSFYGLSWEREVFAISRDWLRKNHP
mgnify:CR=1 FL=1